MTRPAPQSDGAIATATMTDAAARATWRDPDRWLLVGAALALAATFAHPTLPAKRALVDHVIVLDITQSMNVPDRRLDGQPASRLDFARHALREALARLPCGSKVGWGVFTEYRSYLLIEPVEVCANLVELRATLARIDNRMAWSGGSEVAKGLYGGIAIARQLPGRPSLVFVTDGHEAPPVNPRHRPAFGGEPGEVAGLIVGVGGAAPARIPKTDPSGQPLGFWGADEVMQTDPRSQGRGGSVAGEQMAEDADAPPAAPLPGASPGSEHLSSLREAYLRLLAGETGLGYWQLDDAQALAAALSAPALAQLVDARADLRAPLAGAALALLASWLGRSLSRAGGWRRRRRSADPSSRPPRP